MDVNPENCIVVFEYKKLLRTDTTVHSMPTRDQSCIQKAWAAAVEETGIKASQVKRIFSEWSASPDDESFLREHFPELEFSYTFDRPESEDGWDAAFAKARQALAESDEGDVPDFVPMVLPVLRNNDEENMLTQTMVTIPLGKTGLTLALANVAPTPHGTIGVDYVMKANLSADEIDDMEETAFNNLGSQLQIQAGESERGDAIAMVSHPADHGASAIALPGFLQQACDWVKSDKIFIAIPNYAMLLVTPLGASTADDFKQTVMEAECLDGQPLSPACFEFDGEGVRRVATHPSGIWPTM